MTDDIELEGGRHSKPDTDLTESVMSIDLEQQPGYDRLNIFQIWGAKLAINALRLAIYMKYLDVSRLKRIVDFGAGVGGPTFALAAIARVTDGEVTALDEDEEQVREISTTGIIPAQNVHSGDGFSYLNSVKDTVNQGFDLITAFMLGPDITGNLFRKLATASAQVLNDGGNLLVTSDTGTFSVAREIVQRSGVQHHLIHGIADPTGEIVVPHTLIIPKASCGNIR